MIICPYCNSTDVKPHAVRENKDSLVQRYRCLNCDKTFSEGTAYGSRVPKVLILDIETAPMKIFVWGLYKQKPGIHQIVTDWYCLSWAAKWMCESEIMADVLTPREAKKGDDKRIMKSIWKLIDDADMIVAHNGNRFDLRKLNARFLFHKMLPPRPYTTVDTLKQAQRMFATTSHKQEYLTKHLQLPEKIKTEFQLWVDCVNGDQQALTDMVTYNKQDVTGLEDLYFELRPWMKSHPNLGIFMEAAEPVCPACGSTELDWDGYYITAVSKFRSFRCKCGKIGRARQTEIPKQHRKQLTVSVAR